MSNPAIKCVGERESEGEGVQFTHHWRIRKWHPERFGQLCRVSGYGPMNAVLIQFQDGTWMRTQRYFIRKNM